MSLQQPIQININPTNPAQYLACCGIFEIVARFDPAAVSRWETDMVARFFIETTLNEAELVDCLVKTFTNWKNYWRECFIENTKMVKRVNATFALSDELRHTIKLDWWYERLNADGTSKGNNSAWKMFSGNQSVRQIVEARLIPSCKKISSAKQMMNLSELIDARIGTEGRFGFDPSSSRNTLDVGYSPNDLKLTVATYPFVELLAMIAAQNFFPHRTRQSGGHESTRGFVRRSNKSYFQHSLWFIPLTIVLARVFACTNLGDVGAVQTFRSLRDDSRGDYKNLSPSTQTNFGKGKSND